MIKRISRHVFLLAVGFILAFPFLWTISTSFKPSGEVYSLSLIPSYITFQNYLMAFDLGMFGRWILNSTVVAVWTTTFTVFFGALIGYILAKFEFPGQRIIFFMILATVMIPTEMKVIPWFIGASKIGITNTYLGLAFPGLITPLSVFLMKQFMESVPDDLIDSARIDGLGEFQIFLRVALPLNKPALSAVAIFNFVGNWNVFFWPLIITQSRNMFTLPVGLSSFSSQAVNQFSQWGAIMAGVSIATIPVLIMYLIFQRQIIEGVALTGMK